MKNIARALVQTAAFIELSDESVIESSFAVRALEDIASFLVNATEDERNLLRLVASEMAEEARQAGPAFVGQADFFASFLYSVGLDEEPPSPSRPDA